MMRLIAALLFILSIIFAFTTINKKEYPQDYFRSPVNHTIRLSGTFGELRPNHFHAGIDIKSRDGKTGEPLFAIADGYVSRIKVQSGGYGNVLYISHPNGYTSVFAHLDRFPKPIADFVKRKQYERKSFEVDLYPKPYKFDFKKGDEIGRLGLSGRSFGPHLHFEIRDSETEKPINPLLFGFKVEDTRKPRLHELKAYFLNDKREAYQSKTFTLRDGGANYRVKGDTLLLGAWRVGFGLKAYDHMNGVANWNGIYSMEMLQDDKLVYKFEMETFAFSESRYINAHLDYEEQVAKKSYFNRCFLLPGNQLSIYNVTDNDGVIQLHKNKASKITMIVKDIEGNTSKTQFWVRRSEVKPPKEVTYNYVLPFGEENIVDNKALYLYMPKGTLYENLYLQYHSSFEESNGIYSLVHHIHQYKTPVHKYFDISLRPSGLPEELKSKAFIAFCKKDNSIENCGGTWKDGRLSTKVRSLGDYYIMVDQIAPTIKPVHFSSNMKGYNKMTFKVTENYDTARNIDPFHFTATVDGQWILMEYDSKKDLLIHRFDDHITAGEHLLKLIVTDDRGNEKIFERTFVR